MQENNTTHSGLPQGSVSVQGGPLKQAVGPDRFQPLASTKAACMGPANLAGTILALHAWRRHPSTGKQKQTPIQPPLYREAPAQDRALTDLVQHTDMQRGCPVGCIA
jgi:hypothetical protein